MKKKVSIPTLAICCILVFIATFAISKIGSSTTKTVPINKIVDCTNTMDQLRLKNYELVQPLILTDINKESASLNPMRSKIEEYLTQAKNNQQIENASVYFRRMNDGSWFSINPNQTYNPASMSKIIYLITYLKEAEKNPSILNKKIYFARHFSEVTQQNIKNFSLSENVQYTIKDLLSYMIQHSDNDATLLLSQNMNKDIYHQLFKDLNIPNPPEFGEYFITPNDYAKFFRILYNATYLNPEISEFGLKLLTLSTYADGLKKGIDSTVTIAHKFGERVLNNKTQLHEFGIVFIEGDPYLIGVMTSGNSLTQLSSIVSEISRISYSQFASINK
jgi:hypothetical protein